MKTLKVLTLVFSIILTVISCFILFVIIMINRTSNHADYYENPDHYEELTAEISNLRYFEDGKIFLKPDTDTYPHAAFWEINSVNAQTVKDNGFAAEVKDGDEITIVSSYGFVTPGYFRMIVAVKKGNKVYLDQKVGIANLIQDENANYLTYLCWMLIPSLLTMACWLTFYSLARRKRKRLS